MAQQVAQWPSLYNCDGIDLDIEAGAGDAPGAGDNLVAFITRLKQLVPNFHVSQPVYGYPQVYTDRVCQRQNILVFDTLLYNSFTNLISQIASVIDLLQYDWEY